MRNQVLYDMVACAVLALSILPLGFSAFVLGFGFGESPCVLCWAQRSGMALVALSGLLILRFGPRPRYIGLGVLICAHGLYMAARHSALHVARDIGQGFSVEMLGAHTYIWSALVFWVALVVMACLLLLMRDGQARGARRELGPLGSAAGVVFLVAIAGNLAQAFASTGPPPYVGQSDPVRFSLNPRHWVWSLDEWKPVPLGWRGRFDVEKPGFAGLEPDWRKGPLAGLPELAVKRRLQVPARLQGAPADIAYDAASDTFLVATESHGVYVLDSSLTRVIRYTVVDPAFSVDLGRFVGAAFVDAATVVALAHNKSYVVLAADGRADPERNFRYFLESFAAFSELARGRFATVRARMSYVMCLAYDPARDSFYTLSVPSRRYPSLVVSRFERADMTLSEEFRPRLAAGLALAGSQRSLDEYYVTGAAVAGRRLLALSAAYSTLLSIDLDTRELVAAAALAGLSRPAGVAVRAGELFVVEQGGGVAVLDLP